MATVKELDAVFAITRWEEKPFVEADGMKLTRVSCDKSYSGAVAGTSTTEWLMAYRHDGVCTFLGLEHFTGTVDGLAGTLTLNSGGTYAAAKMDSQISVIPHCGTGTLKSAEGTVTIPDQPGHPKEYPVKFRIELP
jgi:Protein of unknown function (DUF3224)